jgi:hypothetical protein
MGWQHFFKHLIGFKIAYFSFDHHVTLTFGTAKRKQLEVSVNYGSSVKDWVLLGRCWGTAGMTPGR